MSCPLRSFPGAARVFALLKDAKCPPPIVAARAALAKLPPVRALRPRAEAVRLAAAMGVSAGVSAPAGRLRARFKKFSAPWIALVHVPVPLVAALRQALALPRVVALATFASSIAGQLMGSMWHRKSGLHRE